MIRWLCVVVSVFVASVMACRGEQRNTDKPLLFAGVPPIAYLVERIAGSEARVETLMKGSQDPHTFEPDAGKIRELCRSSLYFSVGMPFETQVISKAARNATGLHIVDLLEGVPLRTLDEDSPHDHAEGSPRETADLHVWLGPPQLRQVAENIVNALSVLMPAQAPQFAARQGRFIEEIDACDRRVREKLAPCKGAAFYVYHPAFGYFADAYGLRQIAVETGGKSPSPRHIRDLIRRARADGVKVIIVQPQYAPDAAQAIAEAIGGTVVPQSDLGYDVIQDLDDLATCIADTLGRQAPESNP